MQRNATQRKRTKAQREIATVAVLHIVLLPSFRSCQARPRPKPAARPPGWLGKQYKTQRADYIFMHTGMFKSKAHAVPRPPSGECLPCSLALHLLLLLSSSSSSPPPPPALKPRHIYTHPYVRTYIHTYIHTYTHTYTHTYIHMLARPHTWRRNSEQASGPQTFSKSISGD